MNAVYCAHTHLCAEETKQAKQTMGIRTGHMSHLCLMLQLIRHQLLEGASGDLQAGLDLKHLRMLKRSRGHAGRHEPSGLSPPLQMGPKTLTRYSCFGRCWKSAASHCVNTEGQSGQVVPGQASRKATQRIVDNNALLRV